MVRTSTITLCALVAFLAGAFLAAQQPAAPKPLPQAVTQAGFSQPSSGVQTRPGRDWSQLPPIAQQLVLNAQRGSEWLYRMHQPTGKFVAGWNPALGVAAETDGFAHQAAATAALARAARFYRNDAYAARAAQAVLTLLAETGPDPRDPTSRTTTLPSSITNKLAASGLLLLAIAELPTPTADLLEQGEQLAHFIVRQQRADGALVCLDLPSTNLDLESSHVAPAQALFGLMRSQTHRPVAWKLDAVRRALAYYRPWWREHKGMTFATLMTPTFAEAFLQSKDRARDIGFAEFACEMADWLCAQQLDQLDARHPQWRGGFPDPSRAATSSGAPTLASAGCAAALIEAARVTRQLPDADRFARYRDASTLALQFVATLQFTDGNTQHFAPAYRQQYLLGAFHDSPTDGVIRLDGTQQAVAATLAFLTGILEL